MPVATAPDKPVAVVVVVVVVAVVAAVVAVVATPDGCAIPADNQRQFAECHVAGACACALGSERVSASASESPRSLAVHSAPFLPCPRHTNTTCCAPPQPIPARTQAPTTTTTTTTMQFASGFSTTAAPSFNILKDMSNLSPTTKAHLSKVYQTLATTVLASAVGAYAHLLYHLGGLLSFFASIFLLFAIHSEVDLRRKYGPLSRAVAASHAWRTRSLSDA